MEKLLEVIYYIIKLYPQKLDRKNLSKLLYFSDGVYFQHHGRLLTSEQYIHLEEVASPINMNLAIMTLMSNSFLSVEVDFTTLGQKFNRFFLRIHKDMPLKLEREERRIINKVLKAFKNGIIDEDRQYPNLYETYIITPIYGEIKFTKDRINTKIQISKKKSLLNLSGKIFRVLFET